MFLKGPETSVSQGPVSRKSRELFGPEKPFAKLGAVYSVKLIFSYVVKGIKIKLTAKFRASGRLRFDDAKRIMSPKTHPKSFGTFKKQAFARKVLGTLIRETGHWFLLEQKKLLFTIVVMLITTIILSLALTRPDLLPLFVGPSLVCARYACI